MKKVFRKALAAFALLALVFGFAPSYATAAVTPADLVATLRPGESVSETVIVEIPAMIPKADILFSFDLSGSMGNQLSAMKSETVNIIDALSELIDDAHYGVSSFMDYRMYGGLGIDYPYRLDSPLTADAAAVSSVVNGLVLGYGGDDPESYSRALYEAYADPEVGWRDGARRIVIMFGDAVPHDTDLQRFVPGYPGRWNTKVDPGRDAVVGTDDDLDLAAVMDEFVAHGNILFALWSASGYTRTLWENLAASTGGAYYPISNANQIPQAIIELVGESAAHINNLSLVASPGFADWISSTPASHDDFDLPATKTFDLTVTVPEGTAPGDYNFVVSAIGDGASYGEVSVAIHVPDDLCEDDAPVATFLAPIEVTQPGGALDPEGVTTLAFKYAVCDDLVHETKVSLRVIDLANNRLLTSIGYGRLLTYDEATGIYEAEFDPAKYNLAEGSQLRVVLYINNKVAATGYVHLP